MHAQFGNYCGIGMIRFENDLIEKHAQVYFQNEAYYHNNNLQKNSRQKNPGIPNGSGRCMERSFPLIQFTSHNSFSEQMIMILNVVYLVQRPTAKFFKLEERVKSDKKCTRERRSQIDLEACKNRRQDHSVKGILFSFYVYL